MAWLLLLTIPVAYGAGDFLGGRLTTRLSPWAVTGVASFVAAIGALIWALLADTLLFDHYSLVGGTVSGLLLVGSNVLLFLALSQGQAGIVGAIVTLSVVIPVIFDAMTGGLPSTGSLIGILAIVLGVMVISWPGSLKTTSKRSVVFALGAAAFLGFQYEALDYGSRNSSDTAVFVEYIVGAVIVALVALTVRSWGGLRRDNVAAATTVGVLFALGGMALSASMIATNVAIASAVLITEPVVLASLGFLLNRERLTMTQTAALLVVIAGAVTATVG